MKTVDASIACPADLTAAEGTSCSVEGMTCGHCTDPCQFCNELQCQGGKWTQLEAFPAMCDGGT